MLKQFYNYLADSLFHFFEASALLKAGDRYSLHLEKEENVCAFYESLISYRPEATSDFHYRHTVEAKEFVSHKVNINGIDLILATSEQATEHYLTTLRNQVAGQLGAFQETAIVILYSGKLDSLLGGSGDLSKAGMPLNFSDFSDNLMKRIADSSFSAVKKVILQEAVSRKLKELHTDSATIFDLANVVGLYQKGTIEQGDYAALGLFPHEELESFTDTDTVRKALEENQKWFSNIEYVVRHGEISRDLDRKLTPKGIKSLEERLVDDRWKEFDFSSISKWAKVKDKTKPALYLDTNPVAHSEGVFVWDRPQAETIAKRRERNILVFNPLAEYPITVTLGFDDTLKGKLKTEGTARAKGEVSVEGKNIKVKLVAPAVNSDFLYFEFHDEKAKTNKYKFKVWSLPFSPALFEGVEACYTIGKQGHLILSTDGELTLNRSSKLKEYATVLATGDQFELKEDQKLTLRVDPEAEEEIIPFTTSFQGIQMQMCVKQAVELPKSIKGWEVWQDKRIYSESYRHVYNSDLSTLKLYFRNQEFTVRDEFRKTLLLEIKLFESDGLCWHEYENGELEGRDLRLSQAMKQAFTDFVQFYRDRDQLPSLTYMGEALNDKAQRYVEVFLDEVNMIKEDSVLDENEEADLFLLGTVIESFGRRVVKISPVHPLVVAYQLELNSQVGGLKLYEAVLKKLTPLNLLPLIHWENPRKLNDPVLYASKENSHSPEWIYFSNDLHFKQFAGREFIRSLVMTKLKDFSSNFNYLFFYDRRTPLKINVVNMGDCLQVLQGIFDYYKKLVYDGASPHELRPIDLFIYGSDRYVTAFEKMAHLSEKEDIEEAFDISVNSANHDLDDLINALRDKIHFYTRDLKKECEYAHLTFYQFDSADVTKAYSMMDNVPSGLSLDGLISDVPSYYDNQAYITGFGTKYHGRDNLLLETTKAYNALARVSFTKNPFEKNKSLSTNIDTNIKHKLDELYMHSQWVTFVDPHFDLSFFKDKNDLIIIHYSDQYSNASGFDAITVTRKTEQYQFMLQEVLRQKNVSYADYNIRRLIDLYNAINGEWLLRLIGSKDENLRREKLSILSAVKSFLAYYDHPDIIWVPVSLEEILRISGGAGLKQKEGLFSGKNLGATEYHCDDLLMIGLFEVNGTLHVQFYPVEVKIGKNNPDVLKKARLQALKTKQLIYEHLTDEENPFLAKLYRSFFAKIAVMNASKMQLYGVWPNKRWDKITELYRSRLLNDDFVVSNLLSGEIREYAVFAFTQDALSREYTLDEDNRGISVTFLEEDGYNYLVKSIDELKVWLFHTKNSIETQRLLASLTPLDSDPVVGYVEEVNGADTDIEGYAEESSLIEEEEQDIGLLGEMERPMRIVFGEEINDREQVYWYPTTTSKVMHTNTGIIGTMGTGKTQFTKSLITQLHLEGKHNVGGTSVGILIFDYKGDYIKHDFVQATNAKVYNLYHLPYNPLAIDISSNAMPLLPLHIAATLQETIATAFNLGIRQKATLRDVILQAYEEKGIHKVNQATWANTAPTIADICEIYLSDETNSKDSLHAALTQLFEYEIFQPDGTKTSSLYDLLDGVTVINLSGYSEAIQNLVVAITLDAFYSQMQKHGHSRIAGDYRQLTKMILVDEADNFLSKNFISLRKLLKEGREFGVGTILSTQFVDHFSTSDNDYSQYILTWIVHRVNEVKGREVEALFSVSDKDQKENLIQRIKKLEKHHSLVNLAGSPPIIMEDRAFWKLLAEIVT
ncbi:DNA phosphorothioation-dependent restriction protein DptH [Pontibacter anaerobius]|uniref:DNA phosphorothioation-dependent restriction protein DptH n=1 Tax=Pontibacter anaerobius TaxID=2993940 RepID=A0ABT3RIG5_9BACT|nr:DNA phosphorothioation-dependent restriction protein DptH [Pontibacter anaerobius]MCX2741454.1 DNA phosphorothioation-dependent restriction protein DptH [Pontibacter anaerobius]